jgi:hypothetical protein
MPKVILNKGKAPTSVSASAPTAAGIAKLAPSTECITDRKLLSNYILKYTFIIFTWHLKYEIFYSKIVYMNISFFSSSLNIVFISGFVW